MTDENTLLKKQVTALKTCLEVERGFKEWVGLTETEIKHEWEVWKASLPRYYGFAKAIEAKLKEKNT